jgi:hypothetical protein
LGEGDVAALEVFSVAGPGVFAGVPGAFAGVLEGLQAAGRSYLSERQLAAALKADLAAAEAGPKLRGTIREVSIAKLEELSKAGGETVELFTKLDTKLEGDRELFVAIGEGAEDLAAAARTEGQVHRATVPKAVIDELRAAGLVQEGTLTMKGASGTELRFLPEAATYVLKFFN